MKIIDLLNKIANGEEVPKKIKYDDIIYEYDYDEKNYTYFFIDNHNYLFDEEITQILDDKVEILEEEKKIPEKLNTWYGIEPVNLDSSTTFKDNSKYIDFNTEMFFDKINEIIDYLKSKGDE